MIHELKTWPQFWPALCDGSKTFELRKNDRGFEVGDILILLMDECDRCKNKEAKNWEVAAAKRRDALAECLDLKDLYERQNLKWGSAVYKEMGETICGPYEWTCEQATEAAALAEKAYHNCLYDGHFPGYTLLDSWLDDQRAPDPVWDE